MCGLIRVSRYSLSRLIAAVASSLIALQVMSFLSPGLEDSIQYQPGLFQPVISDSDWSGDLNIKLESVEQASLSGRIVDIFIYSFNLIPSDNSCRVLIRVIPSLSGDAGEWVLLFHGLNGSSEFWISGYGAPLTNLLVEKGYTVAAVDLAGHGASCIPGGSSWEDLVEAESPQDFFLYYVYLSGIRTVEAARSLGASSVSLVGVSMGGMTSLVVAALNPAVDTAVVIVSSGCISCMILSGGLANFIGNYNASLDDIVRIIGPLDPLTYISDSNLAGKRILIIFSSHDEYFPLESLIVTINLLKASGAEVNYVIVPNGNHFNLPQWVARSAASFINNKADDINVDEYDYVNVYSRPNSKGTPFIPIPEEIMMLISPTQFIVLRGSPPTTGDLGETPSYLIIANTAIWLGLMIAMASRGDIRRAPVLTVLSIGYGVAVSALPMIKWDNRFALSLAEALERYGSTLGGELGFPTIYILFLGLIVAPAALFMVASARSPISVAIAAALYVAASAGMLVYVRLVFYLILSYLQADPPLSIYPVELAFAALLAISLLMRRIVHYH